MNFDDLPSRQQVLQELYRQWNPEILTETILLETARGRVLAQSVASRNTLPVHRSAGMDGIGVCFADFERGIPDTSGWVKDVNYCMADTGDDFKDPFDTVIAIEAVDFLDTGGIKLHLDEPLKQGQSVSGRGSRLQEGEALLQVGTILSAFQLNLLASGGYDTVM